MYKIILHLTFITSFPICVGLFITARPLVLFVFGDKWEPSIMVMQILALAGLVKIIIGTSNPLFRGKGEPQLELCVFGIFIFVLIPSVIYFTKMYGFIGTAMGVLCAELSQIPIWLWLLEKATNIKAREVARLAIYSMIATTIMGLGLWKLSPFLKDFGYGYQLLCMFIVGGSIYSFLIWVGWRRWQWESVNLLLVSVKRVIKNKREYRA